MDAVADLGKVRHLMALGSIAGGGATGQRLLDSSTGCWMLQLSPVLSTAGGRSRFDNGSVER
jgi:hypothetical protein